MVCSADLAHWAASLSASNNSSLPTVSYFMRQSYLRRLCGKHCPRSAPSAALSGGWTLDCRVSSAHALTMKVERWVDQSHHCVIVGIVQPISALNHAQHGRGVLLFFMDLPNSVIVAALHWLCLCNSTLCVSLPSIFHIVWWLSRLHDEPGSQGRWSLLTINWRIAAPPQSSLRRLQLSSSKRGLTSC